MIKKHRIIQYLNIKMSSCIPAMATISLYGQSWCPPASLWSFISLSIAAVTSSAAMEIDHREYFLDSEDIGKIYG